MAKVSAGLVMYRHRQARVEVLLVHPGGPFWASKDRGVWTIPKGEPETGEELLAAARREFAEETGFGSAGPFVELGSVTQAGGKVVTAWGFEGDCNPGELASNSCEIEWPPKTGKRISIPEVDRAGWFSVEAAREFLRAAQMPLLERLAVALAS